MTGSHVPPSFRLAYVPGMTPGKWVRVWNERLPDVPLELVAVPAAEANGVLRDGGADAGLVRTPFDRGALSAIPLYTETTVVLVPKDHLVTAVDEVSLADLADEIVLHPLDDTLEWEHPPGRPALERPATTADAVELVAAGIGLLLLPQSVARLHHRRDLTYRPVPDAPGSGVGLSWPLADETPELVEEFIGIVRGRTVNSTRGRGRAQGAEPAAERPAPAAAKHKPAGGTPKRPTPRRGAGGSGGSGSGGGRRGKPRRRS
ncbi:LysR substrate-binding domain-containing protein [Streptantibioticus silvisoli]|uniref:LysR substrate-binding domain-containing protein n=1 Tax=Streptantibioticus silvisoli TaxID=2705255 RepID=A0ABT6W7T9_9ACTN|nr:LysR substrate-binding domain-containing protein [Streptantibioticus silvisoli]MDI5966032.1 LysR substrate-binding domain-containing protein [Streptantibioticus silvisoli]